MTFFLSKSQYNAKLSNTNKTKNRALNVSESQCATETICILIKAKTDSKLKVRWMFKLLNTVVTKTFVASDIFIIK